MRDTHLDNAKAALMVLIILGHFIEPLRATNALVQSLFIFLYAIHIPALVLIAGIFAHRELSPGFVGRSFSTLIVPFVTFELIYEVVHWAVMGEVSSYLRGGQPYWLLWFLPSLFVWRLLLPFVLLLRAPLLVSILVSLAISYLPESGYFLGISRTVVLFPFFLFGSLYGRRVITARAPSPLLLITALSLLLAGSYLAFTYRWIAPGWVYGSSSFPALGALGVEGALTRLSLYLISTFLVLAFIALVPRGWSRFGERSANMIYVYLWHGLAVKGVEWSGVVTAHSHVDAATLIVLALGLSVLLFLGLSSRRVKGWTDALFSGGERLICR